MRGVSVGIYVDAIPEEVRYLVDHSESVFVVVRDQEQVDKIIQIRKKIPRVKKVIYWDPKGMWSYDDPFIMSYSQVQELGKVYERENPNFFEDEIEKGHGDDVCIISYTSGTTGFPKGPLITYKNLIATVEGFFSSMRWEHTDNYLSYISPAWVAEQFLGITAGLLSGATINFPENPNTVENDVREIGPNYIVYTSIMWESLCSTILTKIEDGSRIKRLLFNLCLRIGYKVTDLKLAKTNPNWRWRILYWLADVAAFRPLRDKIGLRQTKHPIAGGTLVSPGAFRFFRAVGVPIIIQYGSSEAGICCAHREDDARPDSIGKPFPGTELKISEDGEMLWRGDGLFKGYYKDPKKTAEVLEGGWFHSGDAGYLDRDGHLVYLDRVSDMKELRDGIKYAPQHVESRLKFSPYIRDIISVGGGNLSYVVALVQIDFGSVGQWAERNHIPYTTFADLSQKPQVQDLIENEIKALNTYLREATRIRKFACLPKELDPDEEELTRTRKLRREFIEKKYRELIDAIAEDKDSFLVKSEIKYRDGSKGETATLVNIKNLFDDAHMEGNSSV